MGLFVHELIHFILSFTVGYLVFKRYKKLLPAVISAIIGGVLVDFDHLFDYFIAFGIKFNLVYFTSGYSFLKTDKIYIPLHAWEWVTILLILIQFFRSKKIKSALLAFSLALFFHLVVDIYVNHLTIPGYSIIYRIKNNFELQKLVTEEHYKNHVQEKEKTRYTY